MNPRFRVPTRALRAAFLVTAALAPLVDAACTSTTTIAAGDTGTLDDAGATTSDDPPDASAEDADADAHVIQDAAAPTDAHHPPTDAGAGFDANGWSPDAGSVITCGQGLTCGPPGQHCGTYDGVHAVACDCTPGGTYACGETDAPPPCATLGPATGSCTKPYEVQCVSGAGGCFMKACFGYGATMGTWSGGCEETCPSSPPACNAGCGLPNQSCTCTKNGQPAPCTCFDLGSGGGGPGSAVWLCP